MERNLNLVLTDEDGYIILVLDDEAFRSVKANKHIIKVREEK